MSENVEKKPLNTGEIVWILVASVLVLGGIAYYLTFYRSDEAPPASTENRPLTAEEKNTLLDELKSPTNTKTDTIVAPEEQKTLDSLKATSTPNTTVNNSVLDSLKANK